MKISFPYMGCVTGYKKVFELLGHEVIMPSKPTKKTIDLGVKYSPEFFCFPFKVMTGTYIELAEKNAEVIISSGGDGPCRAGLYGEVHKRIFKELGVNTEIYIFDSIFNDPKGFKNTLKSILNGTSILKLPGILTFIAAFISQMDKYEKQIKIKRAYEKKPGDLNRIWNQIVNRHDTCYSMGDLKKAKKYCDELLESVSVNENQSPVRVGIIGEIYVVMESAVNMDIEEKLNNLGVESYNTQYISDWLKHSIIPESLPFNPIYKMRKKALKYTNINCGGHDMSNMGHIVDFAQRGFDGIIHLMPFSCLPELVTRSVIPAMSKDFDIPILSISIDEQTGAANNQTRLEAFVDLVKARRIDKNKIDSKIHTSGIKVNTFENSNVCTRIEA